MSVSREQSFMLFKPEALPGGGFDDLSSVEGLVRPDLMGDVQRSIGALGLAQVDAFTVRPTRYTIHELWPLTYTLYGELRSRQHIEGKRLPVLVFGGDDAAAKVLRTKFDLRGVYQEPGQLQESVIHSPDSAPEAVAELSSLRSWVSSDSDPTTTCKVRQKHFLFDYLARTGLYHKNNIGHYATAIIGSGCDKTRFNGGCSDWDYRIYTDATMGDIYPGPYETMDEHLPIDIQGVADAHVKFVPIEMSHSLCSDSADFGEFSDMLLSLRRARVFNDQGGIFSSLLEAANVAFNRRLPGEIEGNYVELRRLRHNLADALDRDDRRCVEAKRMKIRGVVEKLVHVANGEAYPYWKWRGNSAQRILQASRSNGSPDTAGTIYLPLNELDETQGDLREYCQEIGGILAVNGLIRPEVIENWWNHISAVSGGDY